ncbi:bifunctional 5,10-methylene-tetrahydrofolate dehydrogenase/5,10-methylene-tetrahydrofolate cyclohydrolase [Ruminococcaceae bacterium OttesenSCG-928-A16]|nr:bifunctional 5,10-methylene-tetrahydrofolate dehydrogenase/5,10-methylene-tetrahydrofolate cyclohydrolase [Ruminococcaceae bacterium OttesenSCG-928-A16]
MAATIIDGKVLAAEVKAVAARDAAALKEQGISPKLVVFLVGENPASAVYVRGKAKDCAECGIDSIVETLPETTTEADLLARIVAMNADPTVHGILVQLPLPGHIEEKKVIEAIDPKKDVDGFTPVNIGRLQIGEDCFVPCTPAGALYMIQAAGVQLAGKDAVVVGRSNIVGKPMAMLLVAQSATVTVCHSKTQNLAAKCAAADVLIAAAGQEKLITANMVKPGAVVIDVGMNKNADGKLCGDVDFEPVSQVAGAITPVPGGVGLMTRAMLMANTIKAAQWVLQAQK